MIIYNSKIFEQSRHSSAAAARRAIASISSMAAEAQCLHYIVII